MTREMLGRRGRESLGSPEAGHAGSPPTSLCRAHPCPISSWLPSHSGPNPGSGGVTAVAATAFGLSSTKEHIQKVCEEKKPKKPKPLSMPGILEDEQG